MVDVLFVAPDLHRGGVGRCVSFIVDAAPVEGISCALFLMRGVDNEFAVSNPNVGRGLARADSAWRFLLGLPLSIWRLRREIRETKPRLICSHGLLCNLIVAILRMTIRANYRSVAFEHNAPHAHYGKDGQGWLKKKLLSYFYPRHDLVVGVSKGVSNDLKAMLPGLRDRCVHVYNGIDLDAVHAQSRVGGAPALALDNLRGDTPTLNVIALGRLAPEKSFHTLIDAARLLDDPRVRVQIVGEGPDEAELRAHIARVRSRTTIELMGHRNNPFPLMASSTVFVLTSIRESFGNVLIEALTLGIPIIAANCPYGPAEILDYGQYGVLVPMQDAPALAQALRDMLTDEGARARFAANGRRRAADFSLDQHCRQVVALFQPLLR